MNYQYLTLDAFLVRELLDNCGSVDEALEYLNSRNIICKNVNGFNVHLMIGDPNKNVVVEFINNKVVVKEKYIMTNFYVNLDEMTTKADGVERFNIMQEHYAEGGESMEGMCNLMKRVRYSLSYDTTVEPFWKSEYLADGDFSWNDPEELILSCPSVQEQITNFKHYMDTGEYSAEMELWFTSHSSIYDINRHMLRVAVRENFEKYYDFKLRP